MLANMVVTTVDDVRDTLTELYTSETFVKDKTGQNVVEIIGASFVADKKMIFGQLDDGYIRREFEWYDTQSLNVNDMEGKVPDVWLKTASVSGKINSNYGWCIYNKDNYWQFQNVAEELRRRPDSRRAIMLYNRPSMHYDYRDDFGLNDFICCTSMQYFIRFGALDCVVNFRSNDAVYGYKNDYAWAVLVRDRLLSQLRETYPDLKAGIIIWNAGSLHMYERHFYLLDYFSMTGELDISKKDYENWKQQETDYDL